MRKKEIKRPLCQFCSQPSSNWKVGHYWACQECGVNLDIMEKGGILQHCRTPQYGGPPPSNRKTRIYER